MKSFKKSLVLLPLSLLVLSSVAPVAAKADSWRDSITNPKLFNDYDPNFYQEEHDYFNQQTNDFKNNVSEKELFTDFAKIENDIKDGYQIARDFYTSNYSDQSSDAVSNAKAALKRLNDIDENQVNSNSDLQSLYINTQYLSYESSYGFDPATDVNSDGYVFANRIYNDIFYAQGNKDELSKINKSDIIKSNQYFKQAAIDRNNKIIAFQSKVADISGALSVFNPYVNEAQSSSDKYTELASEDNSNKVDFRKMYGYSQDVMSELTNFYNVIGNTIIIDNGSPKIIKAFPAMPITTSTVDTDTHLLASEMSMLESIVYNMNKNQNNSSSNLQKKSKSSSNILSKVHSHEGETSNLSKNNAKKSKLSRVNGKKNKFKRHTIKKIKKSKFKILAADKKALAKINKKLHQKHLSKKAHHKLVLQRKALLKAIKKLAK